MRMILGIIIMILGMLVGFYVGLWIMFIGGILDILTQVVHAETFDAGIVAFGIFKIILSGLVGYFSAIIVILPGYVIAFGVDD